MEGHLAGQITMDIYLKKRLTRLFSAKSSHKNITRNSENQGRRKMFSSKWAGLAMVSGHACAVWLWAKPATARGVWGIYDCCSESKAGLAFAAFSLPLRSETVCTVY